MINKLSEYLILNEKAALPGIGTFSVDHTNAKLDFINSRFYAPLPVIRFESGIAETEKYFFNFISNGLEEFEVAGARRFNDFIFDVKHKLSYNGEAIFENAGTLKKSAEGNYFFEEKFSAEDFFPPVPAIRVSRNHAQQAIRRTDEEPVRTKIKNLPDEETAANDHWWMYAIILTAIGVAALTYYYYGGFAG